MTRLIIYFVLTIFSITILSCRVSNDLNSKASQDFSLTIVPMTYPSEDSPTSTVSLYFPERQYFHILVTNESAGTRKVWEEWNSWGFYGLSFEITYPDGRKVISRKYSKGWDRNFPSWITIPPNRQYVFEVNFENDSTKWHYWTNSPLNEQGAFTVCKLKAVYEIRETLESIQNDIWTGRVESEEEEIKIWH